MNYEGQSTQETCHSPMEHSLDLVFEAKKWISNWIPNWGKKRTPCGCYYFLDFVSPLRIGTLHLRMFVCWLDQYNLSYYIILYIIICHNIPIRQPRYPFFQTLPDLHPGGSSVLHLHRAADRLPCCDPSAAAGSCCLRSAARRPRCFKKGVIWGEIKGGAVQHVSTWGDTIGCGFHMLRSQEKHRKTTYFSMGWSAATNTSFSSMRLVARFGTLPELKVSLFPCDDILTLVALQLVSRCFK